MIGARGTDDTKLIKQTMTDLTVDAKIMKKITETEQDYTNNKAAMLEIANSDFKSDFLGGQNHIKLFTTAADKISMDYLSAYDQGCNEKFQEAMKDYFFKNSDGETLSYAECISNFKALIKSTYSNMKFDDTFKAAL
jgi:homogentisate 1,2-dioxygenase